jgi:hypothetical protein
MQVYEKKCGLASSRAVCHKEMRFNSSKEEICNELRERIGN